MQKIFLLADDDSDDTALFREALEDVDPAIICYCAQDGQAALDILENKSLQKPQIIFLDINMPGMNGWECLVELKKNADFKDIPVFIYSTSSHRREANIALGLGADCFFTKPIEFLELKNILKTLVANVDGDLLESVSHFEGIITQKTEKPDHTK